MIKNGKKIISLAMSMLLIFTFTFSDIAFAGKTKTQLEDELSDVKDQQADLKDDLAQVAKDIEDMEKEIAGVTEKINVAQAEIKAAEKNIKKTEEEIIEKQAEILERETNLNARLVVMYKNGSIGFLDVLLGSGSISELVSNVELIKKIYENDAHVLEVLQEEHKALEAKRAELEEKKADLVVKKASLNEQKAELKAEQDKLEVKKKEINRKEDELKNDADALKKQLEELAKKDLASSSTTSTYGGGVMTWPVPASHYITSSYGNRIHPITKVWKFHTGLDIGAGTGSSVLAASSGTVIMATWYGGYGNCIMIDHGGGVTTLYGHLNSIGVSNGQKVSAGQQIGKVGSTGNSTGPHLHFEVRKDGAYVDPLAYV